MTNHHRPTPERRKRYQMTIPWPEMEPVITELETLLDASRSQVLHMVGYRHTNGTNWREWNAAPLVAYHAAKGILTDLKQGIRTDTAIKEAYMAVSSAPAPNGAAPAERQLEPEPPPQRFFTFDECYALLGLVANATTIEADLQRNLVKKIAAEMTRD